LAETLEQMVKRISLSKDCLTKHFTKHFALANKF